MQIRSERYRSVKIAKILTLLLEMKDCIEFSTVPLRNQKDIITAVLHNFTEQPIVSLFGIAAKFSI